MKFFILLVLAVLFGACNNKAQNDAYLAKEQKQRERKIWYVVLGQQQGDWNTNAETFIKVICGGDHADEFKKVHGIWGEIGDTIEANAYWLVTNEATF